MINFRKACKVILITLIIILTNFSIVFADEIDEETDFVWLQEQIINASANSENELTLNSRYIAAFDRTSKTLIFGKNENQRVPMASTTKIMTAIVLIENLEMNSNLKLDTQIEVCKQAGAVGGSRLGLKAGDKITINDLLYGLMLCSR